MMLQTFRCCQGKCLVVGMNTQHCPRCHEDFRSTSAGDDHDAGSYDNTAKTGPRRCRTAAEMHKRGYRQDEHGRWYMPMSDEAKAKAGWA